MKRWDFTNLIIVSAVSALIMWPISDPYLKAAAIVAWGFVSGTKLPVRHV